MFWRTAAIVFLAGCIATQGRLTRSALRPVGDTDRQAYARELKQQAHKLHLAYSTQWLRLGHWKKTWMGSYESQADGENFFLSSEGKTHPDRELDATLEGFFSEL